jgi:6-phospho-beta-glucosidase
MKVAVVGGSAPSTPALFLAPELRALAGRLDVTLIGRSESGLRAVRRAVKILTGDAIAVECVTDLAGLDGAAIVVLQARYGGSESRARDELFPLRHGLCGDEGLGPGGLAAAWRSWPQLAHALETIVERCPQATVLLMTAPLSLLVRCARFAFPTLDVVGICELPWVTLRSVCASLSLEPNDVAFGYAGVNHLGWFDELHLRGIDLIPQYASQRDAAFPSGDLIRSHSAIPLKYLHMHYHREDALNRQRAQPPRATELRSIQQRAMETFASAGSDEIVAALARRPTPWYTHAVAPFIAAMAGVPVSTVFFLSVPNDGYLPIMASDDVVEQPFVIAEGIRRRLPRHRNLGEPLAQTLQHFVEYERVAAHAVLAGKLSECANVLGKHPWIESSTDVPALAADLIAAI